MSALLAIPGCNASPEKVESPPLDSKTTPASPATRPDLDFSSLDRILQEAVPQLNGGVAVVLLSEREIIYRKAFGNYRIESVIPIASSTKWLSGALVMALVDEGKLSLDDPVSKFLPSFSEDKAGITIRHLFAHTSGLPPEASCRNNKRTTLAECAEQISRLPLQSQPGTKFYYGGASMQVGGRVAEVAGGKAWNDLFQEKIAGPLGMTVTDYHAYGATNNPRPAGDARSSLDDYAKFLMAMLNRGTLSGNRILSEGSVTEMHKDQTGGSSIEYTIFWNKGHLDSKLPNATYGIGMWREAYGSEGEILEASSPGALGSYPWIDFQRGVAGVILTRSTFSRSLPVYLRLKAEVQRLLDTNST